MKRAIKILFLSLLWLIFSIPVITVGASTCAAFYVGLKLVEDKDIPVFKNFVKGFKMDFKQGTIIVAFLLPCIYAIILMWKTIIADGNVNLLLIIGAIIFTLIIIATFVYDFPLIARYENTLKKVIKNSLGLCLQFMKKTLLLIVLVTVEIVVISLNKWTLLIGIIIGPGIIIYTMSTIVKKFFNQIENKSDEN